MPVNLWWVEHLLTDFFIKIRFSCYRSPVIKTLEWHFFNLVSVSSMFWLQKNLILMKEMVKKCSTDQRFILKLITSYKIHTFKRNYINSVNAPVSCGQLSLLGVTQSKRILVDPDGKGINDVPIQVSIKTVIEI